MSCSVFFQTFYLCFLVLITVGPVFITTANLSMTRGYKIGLFCIAGCILGDSIFITIGAIAAKAVVNAIPNVVLNILKIVAVCFLLHIAYGFWRTDISKIKTINVDTKKNIFITIKMLLLTLSSPLSIIGYSLIFSQIIDSSTTSLTISAILGGICASIVAHNIIVGSFAFVGKKINIKLMSILNRISAILISCFAVMILVNFVCYVVKNY